MKLLKYFSLALLFFIIAHCTFGADASFNTKSYSNLSVEQIELVLKNTPMTGLGEYILECEKKYNVNAKFIIAVAGAETSYGKRGMGKSKNALFSMKSSSKSYRGFKTKNESIEHFCKVIANGNYYHSKNKITVSQIASRYCRDRRRWIRNVVYIINKF